VCRDDQVGGLDNNQFHMGSRVDGLTIVTYRRNLIPGKILSDFYDRRLSLKLTFNILVFFCICLDADEAGDQTIPTDAPASLIWAVGRLDSQKRPTFHRLWARHPVQLELGRSTPQKNCVPFLNVNDRKP